MSRSGSLVTDNMQYNTLVPATILNRMLRYLFYFYRIGYYKGRTDHLIRLLQSPPQSNDCQPNAFTSLEKDTRNASSFQKQVYSLVWPFFWIKIYSDIMFIGNEQIFDFCPLRRHRHIGTLLRVPVKWQWLTDLQNKICQKTHLICLLQLQNCT